MDKIINYIPGILYLLALTITGLIPNLNAIDRIGPQWVYWSAINTIGLVYIFFTDKIDFNFRDYIKFKPLALFVVFIFWSLLSYFYSINPNESLVKFVRIFNYPVSLYILMVIIKNYPINLINVISIFVIGTLVIELYYSYNTFFQIIQFRKYDFSFAYLLKGASGNKNIIASSILIKIPFVIFFISKLKHVFYKLVLSLIIFATIYLVLLLSARAAIISIFAILFTLIIFYLISLIKNKKYFFNKDFFFVLSTIILSILIFQVNYTGNNSASIANRVSTINLEDTSTQQRIRFYEHSFEQIINNPILGVGSGNWKISSVDYDKMDIQGYTLPYHVHNDFLEIGAELGIIGLFIYIFIFLFPAINIFNRINTSILHKGFNMNLDLTILLSGIIFFIDSNFNFPHVRPINVIPFLIVLAFLFYKNLKAIGE